MQVTAAGCWFLLRSGRTQRPACVKLEEARAARCNTSCSVEFPERSLTQTHSDTIRMRTKCGNVRPERDQTLVFAERLFVRFRCCWRRFHIERVLLWTRPIITCRHIKHPNQSVCVHTDNTLNTQRAVNTICSDLLLVLSKETVKCLQLIGRLKRNS